MICYFDTKEFHTDEPTAVSLGKFDGIHKGHEVLLQKLFLQKENGLKTAVFTFDIPPKSLTENNNYRLLTTNEEKQTVFEERGIDYLLQCPFTREVMCMEPEQFLEWIVASLHVKSLIVGSDFQFGHNRRGNHELLKKLSSRFGYELHVVEKLKYKDREISSSYVREEILKGNIHTANKLLGYPYFVQCEVIHGRQLGRKMKIPTINMEPAAEKLLPPKGVYATQVLAENKIYKSITNVGCKPTVNNSNKVAVETHIFDYEGDLYGTKPKVSFYRFIRPERKFDSLDALQEQMKKDIAACRSFGCYKNITKVC